jgi:carbamate kinase
MLADYAFPAGSMGPKVESACAFVNEMGGFAAIGALEGVAAILGFAPALIRRPWEVID